MIIRNPTSDSIEVLHCGSSFTDGSPRSTAYLIEIQRVFSLVTGEKDDNHKSIYEKLKIKKAGCLKQPAFKLESKIN